MAYGRVFHVAGVNAYEKGQGKAEERQQKHRNTEIDREVAPVGHGFCLHTQYDGDNRL